MQNEKIDTKPWYKQFWPWFIIMLPASAVVASVATLFIAINNPDYMVLEETDMQQISPELRPAKKLGLNPETTNSEKPE